MYRAGEAVSWGTGPYFACINNVRFGYEARCKETCSRVEWITSVSRLGALMSIEYVSTLCPIDNYLSS